jgi:hemoglobin
MSRRTLPWLLVLALAPAGCLEEPKKDPLPRTPSLYTRLGRTPGITKAVDSFLATRAADQKHRHQADVAALKRELVERIVAATGGPQKDGGQGAKEATKPPHLTGADWSALVDELSRTLAANGGGQKGEDELKAALAPLRDELVRDRE